MFLASSHIGVVYDFATNEQKLLQGHVRPKIKIKKIINFNLNL